MKKPQILGLMALALAIILEILFFNTHPFTALISTGEATLGINLILGELAFLGSYFALAFIYKQPVSRQTIVAAVFSGLFSLPFGIWTSPTALSVAGVGFIISNLLFAAFALGEHAVFRHPIDVLAAGTWQLGKNILTRVSSLHKLRPERLSPTAWAVIKGVVVFVPVLLIFLILLGEADAVFNVYLKDIKTYLEKWFEFDTLVRHVINLTYRFIVLLLFFFGALIDQPTPVERPEREGKWQVEGGVILTGTVLLFAVFLLVQSSTLFGGEAAMHNLNMTYAEYARSGFGNLIFISALVSFLILTVRFYTGHQADKKLIFVKVALIVETMLLLASAFMRLGLYIQEYGYTPSRFLALACLITLGLLLALLLANIVRRESQTLLMRRALVVMGVCALIFTVSSPDATSLRLNIKRANAGKPLDINAIVYGHPALTFEAIPMAINALNQPAVPIKDLLPTKPTQDQYCATKDIYYSYNSAKYKDWGVRTRVKEWFESLPQKIAPKKITDYRYVPAWKTMNLARAVAKPVIEQSKAPEWTIVSRWDCPKK